MAIRTRRQTKVSKQTTLLDVVDVGPPKQRVCWRDLNRYFHEAMNSISNVKAHLKTHSLNVNIFFLKTLPPIQDNCHMLLLLALTSA